MRLSVMMALAGTITLEAAVGKVGNSFHVHVYNYAHVADNVLAKAEEEAARLFVQAGVEPIWVACPVSKECHETGSLILNIRPEAGLRTAQRDHEYGFAIHTTAYVFVGSLKGIADSGVVSWPVLLGHVIAHEMGHVLLGPESHSSDGVMRPHLGPEDWRRASEGQLSFNSRQRERIRTFVADDGISLSQPGGPTSVSGSRRDCGQ